MLKHRWSLAHNYLSGITAGRWWRLLADNGFAVDPAYWHRGAFITLVSMMNSISAAIETARFDARVEATPLAGAPLFVLGHWRTGTTHLHNLLALDTANFTFANTYQVVNPLTFLTTEAVNSRLFAGFVPPKRPMDNMALSFQTPQEEEFAPLLMSGLSPYLAASFPRREEHYSRYLTFDGVADEEVDRWKRSLVWFMKKLTLKHPRPVILKSPPHTARVRLLLELFPDARFVHIHREPYTVFQSSRHYFDTAMWYTYLQRPDLDDLDGRIIRRYVVMHDALFRDQVHIPKGRFHDVRFEDLERGPEHTMERLYEALGLEGFDALRPRLRAYLAPLAGYEKNVFPPLERSLRARIASAWGRWFDAWGYSVS